MISPNSNTVVQGKQFRSTSKTQTWPTMNMQVFLLLDKEDKRKWDGNSSSENKDRLTEITQFSWKKLDFRMLFQ